MYITSITKEPDFYLTKIRICVLQPVALVARAPKFYLHLSTINGLNSAHTMSVLLQTSLGMLSSWVKEEGTNAHRQHCH